MNVADKKRLTHLENALYIQGAHGNWDYDPYMHGLYNGLAFAVGVIKGEDIRYKEPPEKWLCDEPIIDEKCDTFLMKIRNLIKRKRRTV